MRKKVTTDVELAALAAQQHGIVATRQLQLSPAAITQRVRSGRLHRLHQGVYAVGHNGLHREAQWMAAVLALGRTAVLSHRSAASLWRIRDGEGPRPDVTSPGRHRHPAVATHRAGLVAADRRVRFGIPVTSPSRTLVDLAHVLPFDELVAAVREAQFLRLFDRRAIDDALTRRPSTALARLLPAAVTQSEMERRFLWICTRHGLPAPECQHTIGAKRYDFAWPHARVVVETDGWQAHGIPFAFQADRTSSNALQLAGWLILRFTWEDLTRRARSVAASAGRALAR
jgi:very-short-patch-repair endonuclease